MSPRTVLAAILVAGLLGGAAGAAAALLLADEEPRAARPSGVRTESGPLPQDWMTRLAFREAAAMNDAAPGTVGVACPLEPSQTCRATVSGAFFCSRCEPRGEASTVELVIDLSSKRVAEWRRLRS